MSDKTVKKVVNENTENISIGKKIFLSSSALVVGGAFGYALQRGNVFLPSVIKGQMNFTNFTMIKMFMTASLTSSLAITFLNSNGLMKVDSLPIMYKRNVIGGLIMGAGIYLTGACPGTVLAQAPLINGTLYTLLGGVAGATLYGFVSDTINKILPSNNDVRVKPTIYEKLGVPMSYATISFSILLAFVLYGIESFFPWYLDSGVSKNVSIFGSFTNAIWSPYAAGLAIGLLQIPSYLTLSNGLGCSSAYVTIGSKVCNTFNCTVDYFKKYSGGARSITGPLLNVGIIAGAYLASKSNPVPLIENSLASLHTPASHFLGGLVLLFGARLSNGCTSGHGLTAMAKQEIGSFLTIASLFAGGIAASYFLNK